MSENWGQPVVVENRPGAGGTIAASIVAKATPDGYTLLATSPGFAITAALQPNLPYDPLKDFAGVAQLGYSTNIAGCAGECGGAARLGARWIIGVASAGRNARPVLNQISKEVARILALPDVRERLHAIGYVPAPSTPDEQDKIQRAQIEILSKVARDAGLRPK